MSKYKRAFPWIALIAGLLAVVCFISASTFVGQARTADQVTRMAVESALQPVLDEQPADLDRPAFRQAFESFSSSTYVVYVWLIDPRGQIVYANSRFANSGMVENYATEDTLRVLESLPSDTLNEDTKVAILAASAIMSEGEHNDVYRQMIRPVYSTSHELTGWVGVSYEANSSLSETNAVYIAVLLLWGLATGVYWLVLPAWVWVDAQQRGDRAGVWAVFVLLGNLMALLAYLLTRPHTGE